MKQSRTDRRSQIKDAFVHENAKTRVSGAIFLTLKSVACPFGILYCQMKDTTPWDFQADTVTQGGLGLIWQKVLLTLHRDSSFFFKAERLLHTTKKQKKIK